MVLEYNKIIKKNMLKQKSYSQVKM